MAKAPSSKSRKKGTAKESPAKQAGGKTDAYVVLARKYRPSSFDDLIGQEAMVTTLRNAFETNRIAQAYMLTGVRGIGKTTTARILARALNYVTPEQDTGPTVDLAQLGEHCQAIMESRHPDVLEMDAASHTGVDNIRDIIEGARYSPVSARYKVYIIDEVHMLSKGAFNALLKTLEEPPAHVKFIFATTEVNKVPVTVLSRCQRFDLRRVRADELVQHFSTIASNEGAEVEEAALRMIARASEGSVRDGLSILDQAIAHENGKVTADSIRAMLGLADRGRVLDLLDRILEGNTKDALIALNELYADGAEPRQVIADLASCVHELTRVRAGADDTAADSLSPEEMTRIAETAKALSIPVLTRAWQMLLKGMSELSITPNQLAAAEMLLIRMTHVADLPTPGDLIKALPEGGAGATPGGPPAPAANRQPSEPVAQAGTPTSTSDQAPSVPPLASFEDVVALAAARRDILLKTNLEEQVRLVRFADRKIELEVLDTAPPTLTAELTQKLKAWTGERWVVVVANERGGETIGERRRAAKAAEIARVSEIPAVKATLDAFPGATVTDVQRLEPEPDQAAGQDDDDEAHSEPDAATNKRS